MQSALCSTLPGDQYLACLDTAKIVFDAWVCPSDFISCPCVQIRFILLCLLCSLSHDAVGGLLSYDVAALDRYCNLLGVLAY